MICPHCFSKDHEPRKMTIHPSYRGPRECMAVLQVGDCLAWNSPTRADGQLVEAGVVLMTCERQHVLFARYVDLEPADKEAALLRSMREVEADGPSEIPVAVAA